MGPYKLFFNFINNLFIFLNKIKKLIYKLNYKYFKFHFYNGKLYNKLTYYYINSIFD